MQDIENEIDFELACNTRHKVLEDTGMSMDWLLKNCSREVNLLAERMAQLKTNSVMEAAYTLWCEWIDEDGQLADLSASRLMVVATFIRDKKITVPISGVLAGDSGLAGSKRAQKIARMVEWAEKAIKTCTLCGKPRTSIGVFTPNNSAQFGAPPGKDRILCYALCDPCDKLPNKIRDERIELQLIANTTGKPHAGRVPHPDFMNVLEVPASKGLNDSAYFVNAISLNGTTVKFCVIKNPDVAHLPEWKREAALAADGTVFMPAFFCGAENIVFLAVQNYEIPIILSGDHLLVPTDWVVKSFPDNKELKALAESVRRGAREHFGVGP